MARSVSLEPVTTSLVTDQVQEQIIERVRNGDLGVNDTLPPERDLAVQLGISRTTVRAALRSHAARGVLESRQGAGWFVRPSADTVVRTLVLHLSLSDIGVEQLAQARQLLEPALAAIAATSAHPQDLEALEACHEAMVATNEPRAFLSLNTQFHELIARSARNPLLEMAIRPILAVIDELSGEPKRVLGRRELTLEEHRRVLDDLQRHDALAAERGMLAHLVGSSNAGVVWERAAQENPSSA